MNQEEEKDFYNTPGLEVGFQFPFNNLWNDPNLVFTETGDPDHPRVVTAGLNIQGTCNNRICRGYCEVNHRIWVPLGYGKFNIHQITYTTKCRLCTELVVDVDNMCFMNAKVKIQGKRIGDRGLYQKSFVHDEPNSVKMFQQANGICHWSFLHILVGSVCQ